MRQLKIQHRYTIRENSANNYFSEVSKRELLTPEEEIELSTLAASGDRQAINKLVTANLRFVISVAKQFHSPGVELVDLIQAGNMGIIIAAEKFDPTKGFKFISYAVWWIRQKIMEHLQQEKIIRLPGNAIEKIKKSKTETEKRKQEINNDVFFSDEEVQDPILYGRISKYLSDPVGKENSDTFESLLTNYSPGEEDNNLSKEDLKHLLLGIFDTCLSDRESFIIKHRYGINCRPMLLEDIGEWLGFSKERTRQIEVLALDKLRRHKDLLRQYLN